MAPFTTPQPVQHQLENRRYTPLTPSPLNPNTPSIHLRTTQRHHRPRTTAAAVPPPPSNTTNNRIRPTLLKPSSSPANRTQQRYARLLAHDSPTQRLLRQKAATAWRRSEVLRLQEREQHHHYHHCDRSFPDFRYLPEQHQQPHLDAARGAAAGGAIADCSHQPLNRKGDSGTSSGDVDNGRWEADLTITNPLADTDAEYGGPGGDETGTEAGDEEVGGRDSALLMMDNRKGSGSKFGPAMLDWQGTGERGRGDTAWAGAGCGFDSFEEGRLEARLDPVQLREDRAWRAQGSGGGTLRRMLVVVVVVVGLGLAHGLVSAFGSWAGGGVAGGRPLAGR
ncbi:hypothetical protein N657DRAFT_678581 [Parathielavia appendiculata]|uniref:Uncharacterized protein n=1 Tax=Parathielavia appendiculata TaxID=2587402 RepID=A0AAN6U308_9PEZI|nr:hypothetical protein N657DRAFT_678581 [Parathielavia appendiculata]